MNLDVSLKSMARKVLGDDVVDKVRDLPKNSRTARLSKRLPKPTAEAIDLVKARRWTFLSDARLTRLAWAAIETAELDGSIAETGCALGGSAIVLAASKRPGQEMNLYDVFAQIPPPTERDGEDCHVDYERISSGRAKGIGEDDRYYGYIDNLYDLVQQHFADAGYDVAGNNVKLHRGLVEDTLHPAGPIRLAHIDVDWFDPVMVSLERLEPRVPVGGVIQLDDYFDYSGCRDATDKYFAEQLGERKYQREEWTGSLTLTRIK